MSELSNPVVWERVGSLWSFCKFLHQAHPHAVWVNFDETPLWYAQSSGRANIRRTRLRGRRPVRLVGKASLARKRITVGLTVSTDVGFALSVPAFAIFRGERDCRPDTPQWAGVDIPEGVEVRWQRRAWMDENLAAECVGLLMQARGRMFGPDRVLVLVWDSFQAHLTDAIKIYCRSSNIIMVLIPRGLTSVLQGLDTHVNKSFKASCRKWWRRFVLQKEHPSAGVLSNQDFGRLVRDSVAEALQQRVPSGALQGWSVGCASFLHNGLTNAVDGTEDSLINIRHEAVEVSRRVLSPSAPPAEEALAVEDVDTGYGSEASVEDSALPAVEDKALSGSDAEGGGGVIARIPRRREEWLDRLEPAGAGPGDAPVRGFVGPPGGRRSTRRARAAVPKQDLFAGAAARSSASPLVVPESLPAGGAAASSSGVVRSAVLRKGALPGGAATGPG